MRRPSAYNYRMRSFAALSVLLTALISFSCVAGNQNANSNTNTIAVPAANAAKTNIEELGLYVKVPYETEDIVWKEFPANKRLTAALRFSSADANKLVEEARGFGPVENVSLPVEPWFPDELIAQGEMSGDSALRGQAYVANSFFQEPYTAGRVIRIEGTDYFILEVSAK